MTQAVGGFIIGILVETGIVAIYYGLAKTYRLWPFKATNSQESE